MRIHQNLENKLPQHKIAIDSFLKYKTKGVTSHSAVMEHILDLPHHNEMFDQTKIIDSCVRLL